MGRNPKRRLGGRVPRLALVALASVAALTTVAAGGAATRSGTPLKIGDEVKVDRTKIACYAITSNSKKGIACVLVAGGKPAAGSYGAGLSVDGTAVITRIKADGSGEPVFKRRLQGAGTLYRAQVGTTFGLPISPTVSLGCRVIDVTSTSLAPVYRGSR